MARFVFAFLLLTLVVATIGYLAGRFSRTAREQADAGIVASGGGMQRISFFLLLCLMTYVSVSGLS